MRPERRISAELRGTGAAAAVVLACACSGGGKPSTADAQALPDAPTQPSPDAGRATEPAGGGLPSTTTLPGRPASGPTVSLRDEALKTLTVLADALAALQLPAGDPNAGGIRCPQPDHAVLHTRAAEAVLPFAIAYRETRDRKYLDAAVRVGNWLFSQQDPDGSWRETPDTWTGTTADQLMMLAAALPVVDEALSAAEKQAWRAGIARAADYLVLVMSQDFASINYLATTAAALAATERLLPDARRKAKAQDLARQVVARMNAEGFVDGEGDRAGGIKYGVDLGYGMDMTLWGLALYARLEKDATVDEAVRRALPAHFYFVFPDGSIDGSWGIRSNKWTTYGSKTADGPQILFALYAGEEPRYRTGAVRNLEYLRGMIKDGMVGYGPHHFDLYKDPPCVYPTFARAKAIALAILYGDAAAGPAPPLPTEEPGWARHFATVNVALARTRDFLATVTAYGYKDGGNWATSKYMHRPAGGSLSNLWVKDHGFLQASSQTVYLRSEVVHFPDVRGMRPLTPRIEFAAAGVTYTNLYEFDARMTVVTDSPSRHVISTTGRLKAVNKTASGVSYTWTHVVLDDAIEKTVRLQHAGAPVLVSIIEPIVLHPGMRLEQLDEKTVAIRGGRRAFRLAVTAGTPRVELGPDPASCFGVFPALRCGPITLTMTPATGQTDVEVTYRLALD